MGCCGVVCVVFARGVACMACLLLFVASGESALEQYAFSISLQAYVYGFPLVITEVTRSEMMMNPGEKTNRFNHFSRLFTPATKIAVSANVDTLMSTAWMNFSGC